MCQGKITGNWTQEKYKESMLETGDIGDDSTMIGNMIITDIMPSNPVQVSVILGTCYFDDYSLFLPSIRNRVGKQAVPAQQTTG